MPTSCRVASSVNMIVLGAAVLRARRRRVRPPPRGIVVVIPSIAAFDGPPALVATLAPAVWDLLWLGTAVAVLTHARATAPRTGARLPT